jgi:hypothetical protein
MRGWLVGSGHPMHLFLKERRTRRLVLNRVQEIPDIGTRRPTLSVFIRTGGVMGLRSTQGDQKRLGRQPLPIEPLPSPCHLDRSVAQWRDLCVDAPSWKCFSDRAKKSAVAQRTTEASRKPRRKKLNERETTKHITTNQKTRPPHSRRAVLRVASRAVALPFSNPCTP